MSVFMKSCFECGKKTNELIEGKCKDCYTGELPPIKEIKPLNVKFCNSCGKIHYNNTLYDPEEFEKMFPNLVKSRLVLNEGYKLKNLEIEDFMIEAGKLSFEVNVDADLKS